MRASLALASWCLLLACSPSPSSPDAGGDASTPDAGPPRIAPFAELGAVAEGIALGSTSEGEPVLYVSTRDDRIVRVRPDGTTEDFLTVDDPLGIAVQADGDLVVCARAEGAPRLLRVTRDGTVSTLVANAPDGSSFGLTNFVAVAPDDSVVFTDSMADRVYRADADGSGLAQITDAIPYPNGLAFSTDGSALYVASWSGDTVYALPFDRDASTYGTPTPALTGVTNVDGIVTTSTGELVLVTSSLGVLLATPGSETRETLASSRSIVLPANGVFGDEAFGRSSLFVAALGEMQVFRVRTELEGAPLPVR